MKIGRILHETHLHVWQLRNETLLRRKPDAFVYEEKKQAQQPNTDRRSQSSHVPYDCMTSLSDIRNISDTVGQAVAIVKQGVEKLERVGEGG